jgi:DNA-binding response OmpR family regulator
VTRILIVDDMPSHGAALVQLLHCDAWEVDHVERPQELADETEYELAILDLHHRDENGFEMGVSLLEKGIKRVAIFTFNPRETDFAWAQALGICAVFSLPISAHEFKSRIQQLVGTSLVGGDGS